MYLTLVLNRSVVFIRCPYLDTEAINLETDKYLNNYTV